MKRPSPHYLVISGVDGCGKTTLIRALQQALEERGLSTRTVWLRYTHCLVRPLHALCRLVGLSRRYHVDGVSVWRHEFYRSRPFSALYVVLSWLDAWLGRAWLALRLRAGTPVDVVICDRWALDILVDVVVSTRLRALLRDPWSARFMRVQPAGARQYLVTRAVESIVAQRPDTRRDLSYSLRCRLYRRLCQRPDVCVIPNDDTIDRAVNDILAHWQGTPRDVSVACSCVSPS